MIIFKLTDEFSNIIKNVCYIKNNKTSKRIFIEDHEIEIRYKYTLKKLIEYSLDPDISPILLKSEKTNLSGVLFLRFYKNSFKIKNITAFFIKSEEFIKNVYVVKFNKASDELENLLKKDFVFVGQDFVRKVFIEDIEYVSSILFKNFKGKDLQFDLQSYLKNNSKVKENVSHIPLLSISEIIKNLKEVDYY